MKNSIIIPKGAYPEPQEENVAKLLSEYGVVEFIPPLRTKGVHTPDIFWLNKPWEIKTPRSKSGRWSAETMLNRAVKQSENIIVDLRYIKDDLAEHYIRELTKQFQKLHRIRHLKIITRPKTIVDLKRKT